MPNSIFHSPMLYDRKSNKYLPYLLGFCAFIFIIITVALLSLELWKQAAINGKFIYNEFYTLIVPTQALLATMICVILWGSLLIIRMSCSLMVERNRMTLQLLRLMGAYDQYIIRSFHYSTFKANMSGVCIGALAGATLLWGVSRYLKYIFTNIYSILPKIGNVDFWFLLFWLLTVSIFGIVLMIGNRRVVQEFLR